jgi:trimeric autotransporter adhesin
MDSMKRFCLAVCIFLVGNLFLSAQTVDPVPDVDSNNYNTDVSELFGDTAWFGRYHPILATVMRQGTR